MRIPLDRQVGTPLYRQIEAHLRQGILSGSLAPGTRLPAARQLARDLGLNRITAESAYAELEADGLIRRCVGSGTYVLPPQSPPLPLREAADTPWPLWQQALQDRGGEGRAAAGDERLAAASHPGPIDFALGVGDAELFPVSDLRKALQAVLKRDGAAALELGESAGYAPLRRTIAQVLASQGIQARAASVLVTSGSQQALALVAELLLKPGDAVLVERPTYSVALELFRSRGLTVVGAPTDEQGLCVDEVEALLQQHHAKLVYTIPNFQNPTGTCLSGPRRRALIALADRYNVAILEDDFVGDLRYEGRALPALKALDPGGRVLYVSAFSKMLLPGLRVGFVVADGPVFERLAHSKRVHDLATSNLLQRALEAYVTVGRYQVHLRRSCRCYRARRDAMLAAIERHLPASVRADRPHGGLFIWLRLPEAILAEPLLAAAHEEGVGFAPGRDFFADGVGGERCLRLNFAAHAPDVIEEGVRRLGHAMRRVPAAAEVLRSPGTRTFAQG